jgi:hypothetical protein
VSTALSSLVSPGRIAAIDEAAVPAPPSSAYPGEHWFVNCHYDPSMSALAPALLLHDARDDALAILRRLVDRPGIRDFISVVITVYTHIPVTGASRPARRRAYRTHVLSSELPDSGSLLTSELFQRLRVDEDSELDDIAELLHQTAS